MSEANEKNVQQAAEEIGSKEQKSMQAADERKKQKRTDRIMSKIETQIISAGGQLLKRGLLGILKLK